MIPQENITIIREIFDSLNQRDFEKVEKQIADTAEINIIPRSQTLKGPEGVRQFMQNRLSIATNGMSEVKNIIACEDTAVVEYTMKGTHDGIFTTPSEGEFQPTGKTIDLPFCDLITIKDGKVTKWVSYFDLATIMRQIGILHEVVHH